MHDKVTSCCGLSRLRSISCWLTAKAYVELKPRILLDIKCVSWSLGTMHDVGDTLCHRDEEMGLQRPLLSFEESNTHSEACEEALMKVVSALSSAHEMLPLSQNEAYVGTFFGRMWFLPGLVWCGFKHIPKEQIKVSPEIPPHDFEQLIQCMTNRSFAKCLCRSCLLPIQRRDGRALVSCRPHFV